MIIGILFVTLVVLCEYGAKKVPSAIGFTILVAVVTVASTYVRVKLNIKRGHYLHRKNIINEKIIAFISSAIGIAICIIIFQFIKLFTASEMKWLYIHMCIPFLDEFF